MVYFRALAKEPQMTIRTRFAPSPTGNLHLGGVRTALFNWLFARKHQGQFILRIEDTDQLRSTQESATGIIESLIWLGIDWDEGPYFQSDRLEIYQQHLEQLRQQGLIYPAFESKEELELMRQKAIDEKRQPIYDRSALALSEDEIQHLMHKNQPFVWRFKVAEGVTEVPELLMGDGHYQVDNQTIGDFVLTRPGTLAQAGMPLYNFVCAVDDALMQITHVIRGVEHLQNTAKQILLYQAFNHPCPKFVHLPLIMKNGKKMSKRDLDLQQQFPVSILERRDLGYLPEASLNYLALLGWAPNNNQEFFSLEGLIKEFDLNQLSKANANFDEDKYFFLNAQYMKSIDNHRLLELAQPFLDQAQIDLKGLDNRQIQRLCDIAKSRSKVISEFPREVAFAVRAPKDYEEKAVEKFINTDKARASLILIKTAEAIEHQESDEDSHDLLNRLVTELNIPFSKFGPVIRLALTGGLSSPSLVELIDVLGKEQTINRLQAALKAFI